MFKTVYKSSQYREGGSWTLYYLNKAEREMRNNNLDTAARYLNQLVGKPRAIVTVSLENPILASGIGNIALAASFIHPKSPF